MIEQQVLIDIDGQRSWAKAQLDDTEPLLAFERRMPSLICGRLVNISAHLSFQLALGKLRRMVFNEESTLYFFSFLEENGVFVAMREDEREPR